MSKAYLRQRLWLLALYAAGVVVATLQRGVWSRDHTTFSIFRQSFVHLAQHQNLYAAYPAEQGAAAVDLFKYSPSAAVLFAPLALIPFSAALLAWNLLNAGLFFFAITRTLPRARANLALLLLAPEVFVAIQSSSSNALVTALLVLAALAFEKGRHLHGGVAVAVGTSIKLFPIAALVLALLHREWRRTMLAVAIVGLALLALPLLVVSPSELIRQYRWWGMIEGSDAKDLVFGLSLMREMRNWRDLAWPNWTLQLLGVLIFIMPLVLRRDRSRSEVFRLQYLSSLLLFVVLFNHQAERQSFILAATGSVLWFVTGSRTLERSVLLALALIGVPTVPYLVIWLIIHAELLRPGPSLTLEAPTAIPWLRRISLGRQRQAS